MKDYLIITLISVYRVFYSKLNCFSQKCSYRGKRNLRSIKEVSEHDRMPKAETGWWWPWATGTVLTLRAHGCCGISQELMTLQRKLKGLLFISPYYIERICCLQLHKGIKFYMKGLNSWNAQLIKLFFQQCWQYLYE